MRSIISIFLKLVAPLYDLLDENYTVYKTRKTNCLMNFPIRTWEDESTHALKASLRPSINSLFLRPKTEKRLCLFIEVPELYCSFVLT